MTRNISKKLIIGSFAICVSAILWGLDGVVLTPRLYNLDVAFVVFMLHLIPFVIMNAFLFKEYRHLKEFTKADYATLLLISLLGGAVGTLAIVKALFLVNFQHLSIIVLLQKLQPVFAIFLALILLKERIRKEFVLWAALAIAAGYFLTFGFSLPNMDTGANTLYAALYSLLAAFAFGSSTVFGKKILQKYNFWTATFYRFGFTSLFMALYLLLFGSFYFQSITPENWFIFFIIAFTTGSGAIFLYYFGLKKVRAVVSTICELCFPVSVVLFDYFINGTVLSPVQWIAAIIMLASIVRISFLKPYKPKPRR